MTIADLLDRDFSRPIEEIIKVNNADEESVYTELTEYVATDRIKTAYEGLFKAMADAPPASAAIHPRRNNLRRAVQSDGRRARVPE